MVPILSNTKRLKNANVMFRFSLFKMEKINPLEETNLLQVSSIRAILRSQTNSMGLLWSLISTTSWPKFQDSSKLPRKTLIPETKLSMKMSKICLKLWILWRLLMNAEMISLLLLIESKKFLKLLKEGLKRKKNMKWKNATNLWKIIRLSHLLLPK